MDPEAFNSLEYSHKFVCFIAVFNEYVEKVAIPKRWAFTETIKHWPDGTGEGEGVSEDGRVWYSDEKNTLLQEVLNYPDLGVFAMENYGLLIDSYAVPNKEDKTGPPSQHCISTRYLRLKHYRLPKKYVKIFRNTKRRNQ